MGTELQQTAWWKRGGLKASNDRTSDDVGENH